MTADGITQQRWPQVGVITVARKISSISLIAVAMTLLWMDSLGAVAGTTDQSGEEAVRTGIQATLDRAKAVVERGGSAQEFVGVLYDEDLIISGEGDKTYRGSNSFVERMAYYLKNSEGARCEFSIIGPIRHSGNLATAFIREHCDPAKAGVASVDLRVLGVFRNGAQGWRETQELFAAGIF